MEEKKEIKEEKSELVASNNTSDMDSQIKALKTKNEKLAIAAFVLGIVGLTLSGGIYFLFNIPVPILAIVFGAKVRGTFDRKNKYFVFATLGFIFGIVGASLLTVLSLLESLILFLAF